MSHCSNWVEILKLNQTSLQVFLTRQVESIRNSLLIKLVNIPSDNTINKTLNDQHSQDPGKAEVVIRWWWCGHSVPCQTNFNTLKLGNDKSSNPKASVWQKAWCSLLWPGETCTIKKNITLHFCKRKIQKTLKEKQSKSMHTAGTKYTNHI